VFVGDGLLIVWRFASRLFLRVQNLFKGKITVVKNDNFLVSNLKMQGMDSHYGYLHRMLAATLTDVLVGAACACVF